MKLFVLRVVLVMLVPLYFQSAVGAESNRYKNLTHGKFEAPGVEEHASYFAKEKFGGSEADLLKADKLRIQTIESIQQLIESADRAKKFELMLRLGELHVERHDFLRHVEINSFAEAHDAWLEKKEGQEPVLSHTGSKKELTNATNVLRAVVSEFPTNSRADTAMLALAQSLARLGNENAELYYKQLLRLHPKSNLRADAYLALGELYFENHKISKAIEHYKKAIEFKEHRAYPYAVYKLGWAYFNKKPKDKRDRRKLLEKVVAAFKLVVKLEDQKKTSSSVSLKNDALRDLIVVWTETEAVEEAWKYYKSLGDTDNFYVLLERLGYTYAENGQNKKSITVLKRLLSEAPLRENNPQIYAKVADVYKVMRQPRDVASTMESMKMIYVGNTAWTRNQKESSRFTAENMIAKKFEYLATLYHQEGTKNKKRDYSKAYLASAIKLYKLYLQAFEGREEAYNMRYYLADLLFDLKRYELAADQFFIVSQAKKEGKHAHPSATNAVIGFNKAVEKNKFKKLPPAGQVGKPMPIPELKSKLVKAIENFVSIMGEHKDSIPMRYTAAGIYFDYGHYPEAMTRFEDIVTKFPDTKQGAESSKAILAYQVGKKDWLTAIETCKRFKSNQKLYSDKKLKNAIDGIYKKSLFNAAVEHEKAKRYLDVANLFAMFQSTYPKDTDADRAYYNAALNYFKSEDVEKGLSTAKALVSTYPASNLKQDTLALIAETHQSLTEFEKAAFYFEALAKSIKKLDKRGANALFNAGIIRIGLGQKEEASKNFQDFLTRYPKHKLFSDALLNLAEIQEEQKRYESAKDLYRVFYKRYQGDNPERYYYARAKLVELEITHGSKSKGLSMAKSLQNRIFKDPKGSHYEARRILAKAFFEDTASKYITFKSMDVTGEKDIEKSIRRKQTVLINLAATYQSIIELRAGEYVVASLYRLGEMHEIFSNDLFRAKPPADFNQNQVDEFKTALEKLAFPLKEDAMRFFKEAYARSSEVQTLSNWTILAYEKMAKYFPGEHPSVNVKAVEPKYLSHSLFMEEAVVGLASEE